MIICELCGYLFRLDDIEDHLITAHDVEPLDRWPDGQPVIIDSTLEPADFEAPT